MILGVRLSIDSLILLAGAIAGKLSTFDDLAHDVPSAARQSLADRSGRSLLNQRGLLHQFQQRRGQRLFK